MMTVLPPLLAALLGYLTHWAQVALERRHEEKKAEIDLLMKLHEELHLLRDGGPDSSEFEDKARDLKRMMSLVKDERVSSPLIVDLLHAERASDFWPSLPWRYTGEMLISNSINILSSALRKERPRGNLEERDRLIFFNSRRAVSQLDSYEAQLERIGVQARGRVRFDEKAEADYQAWQRRRAVARRRRWFSWVSFSHRRPG
ncbi:hypothetical protein KQY30_25845 [Streptomyces sp. GMY02]|uniref:hypothetical protein n=1 Tax=Streptomyces sp. GMY02 TaxID=1333528 RepID=UPI001C2C73E1|nr:hypothetical protein [Streptomyces sp. GMY02]QXE37131.1 hypothetical protein KQY30_25845 [Streptomyces sp. GMY02]